MKGVVFTEFLEMVENEFGWEMAEDIVESSTLDSEGVYTAVGTYDYNEMVMLVVELSKRTEIAVPDLLRTYGMYLFGRFVVLFPAFFEHVTNTMDFADMIEDHIHVEVRKLYPKAELPSFDTARTPERMSMVYRSARPFADFAEGLLRGAINHFNGDVSLERNDITDDNKHTEFVLRPVAVSAD